MRFKGKYMSRVWIAVPVILAFLAVEAFWGPSIGAATEREYQQKTEPLHITVILERSYLDGEISQEVIHETSWSMESFWAKYDQWQLVSIDESTYVFQKQVDDISPLLKANGYFGLTEDGVLTIFNGRPDRSRIIQSFFQIDVKKLESKAQQELLQGIPIKTKDKFVEVLETFKHYTIKKE